MDPRQINHIEREVRRQLADQNRRAKEGLAWLRDHMHPYFFVTMGGETEVLANLLMDDATFLTVKEVYVRDVLAILERRAEEEARL
ncbi:MAG: hypothetical protein Q8P24_20075 [Desulfobacterales bacterium]|nr:hypothetical protein [Desulfobacterales bacterium]